MSSNETASPQVAQPQARYVSNSVDRSLQILNLFSDGRRRDAHNRAGSGCLPGPVDQRDHSRRSHQQLALSESTAGLRGRGEMSRGDPGRGYSLLTAKLTSLRACILGFSRSRRGRTGLGLCFSLVARAGTLAGNKPFGHFMRIVVGVLLRRALHELGGSRQ